jgi:hypothetical protein
MDEAVLADLERELASPARRTAPEDRSQRERVDLLVVNSYLVHAVPDLVAEVRRLQGVEREALRVLGAVINQHVQGCVDVPEEALRRDYTVGRVHDPATLSVRFRAEPAGER